MNLNKVFVLGNLTRDPEKRSLPSGQAVVSFGIATNRFFTQEGEKQQETEFHNITAFGKLADIASQYLQKGSMVLIEGRLRTRSWQDSSGIKHFKTEIIADNLQLGPKREGQTEFKGKNIKNKNTDEDIPVIEEESEKNPESSQKKKDSSQDEEEEEQEIDISKIPF